MGSLHVRYFTWKTHECNIRYPRPPVHFQLFPFLECDYVSSPGNQEIKHEYLIAPKLQWAKISRHRSWQHISQDFLISSGGGIRGTVLARCTAGQQSSDRSCIRGMIHSKIHLIIPVFPRPRMAF